MQKRVVVKRLDAGGLNRPPSGLSLVRVSEIEGYPDDVADRISELGGTFEADREIYLDSDEGLGTLEKLAGLS